MKPIEVVIGLIPSLNEKELMLVVETLRIRIHPCNVKGHKMRKALDVPAGWFNSAYTVMICEKCGLQQQVFK